MSALDQVTTHKEKHLLEKYSESARSPTSAKKPIPLKL